MPEKLETRVSCVRIRERVLFDEGKPEPELLWSDPPKKKFGEHILKNIALSSALVLCAVVLRTGSILPLNQASDLVMTAASDHSLLDEQLGKLSFVSTLFPEAVLVFGEQQDMQLILPVSAGAVVHAWSEEEPFTAWHSESDQVLAACEGEVIGVYHGNNGERLVQVLSPDGIACLYGNLEQVSVKIGDIVYTGGQIGTLLPEKNCVFEVRTDGYSIDPCSALYQR